MFVNLKHSFNYITVLEIVVRGMNIVENLGMLDTPVPFILKQQSEGGKGTCVGQFIAFDE